MKCQPHNDLHTEECIKGTDPCDTWRMAHCVDDYVRRTPEEQDDFLSVYSAHKAMNDAEHGRTGHA